MPSCHSQHQRTCCTRALGRNDPFYSNDLTRALFSSISRFQASRPQLSARPNGQPNCSLLACSTLPRFDPIRPRTCNILPAEVPSRLLNLGMLCKPDKTRMNLHAFRPPHSLLPPYPSSGIPTPFPPSLPLIVTPTPTRTVFRFNLTFAPLLLVFPHTAHHRQQLTDATDSLCLTERRGWTTRASS